jgi:hypothetical protein
MESRHHKIILLGASEDVQRFVKNLQDMGDMPKQNVNLTGVAFYPVKSGGEAIRLVHVSTSERFQIMLNIEMKDAQLCLIIDKENLAKKDELLRCIELLSKRKVPVLEIKSSENLKPESLVEMLKKSSAAKLDAIESDFTLIKAEVVPENKGKQSISSKLFGKQEKPIEMEDLDKKPKKSGFDNK